MEVLFGFAETNERTQVTKDSLDERPSTCLSLKNEERQSSGHKFRRATVFTSSSVFLISCRSNTSASKLCVTPSSERSELGKDRSFSV